MAQQLVMTSNGLTAFSVSGVQISHVQYISAYYIPTNIPNMTDIPSADVLFTGEITEVRVGPSTQFTASDDRQNTTYSVKSIAAWNGNPTTPGSVLLGVYSQSTVFAIKQTNIGLAIYGAFTLTDDQQANVSLTTLQTGAATTIKHGLVRLGTNAELLAGNINTAVVATIAGVKTMINNARATLAQAIDSTNNDVLLTPNSGNAMIENFNSKYFGWRRFQNTSVAITASLASPKIIWCDSVNSDGILVRGTNNRYPLLVIENVAASVVGGGIDSGIINDITLGTGFSAGDKFYINSTNDGLANTGTRQVGEILSVGSSNTQYDVKINMILSPIIEEVTLTDGATINWDLNKGYWANVTLGGNRTLAVPTNGQQNVPYLLRVSQDTTGSRTLTLDTSINKGELQSPALSKTASTDDLLCFIKWGNTVKYLGILKGY